jgi:hypothetical protein
MLPEPCDSAELDPGITVQQMRQICRGHPDLHSQTADPRLDTMTDVPTGEYL